MKRLLSILCLIPLLSFSQYPSWFPNEFKNKIFCGEFDCSGKYLGRTNYNTVPYKLHISESGIFVEINPGDKFGRSQWGQTIKLKYNYKEVRPDNNIPLYRKTYEIDLNSSNETEDSPIHPKYTLKYLAITVDTYNGQKLSRDAERSFVRKFFGISHIAFRVIVPYYGSGGPAVGTWGESRVCGVLKTKSEILKEEAERKRQEAAEEAEKKRILRAKEIQRAKIRELINNNKISEAAENYSNSEFKDLTAKSEIQKALNNYYSENIYVYKKDFINAYLNTNKDYFKTLKDGKYTFKFDKYGSPNESKLTEIEYKDIPRKKIFDFTVNLKSEFTIVIKTTDPILIETKYYANANKPIYYNKNDSFFFKTKMGLPQISSSEFVFDEKIPKNTIKISKTFEVKKYANELLINSEQYNKTINATIFKKG